MAKVDYEKSGKYFRQLREDKKLQLRKLAAELDIDTSPLSKFENGERRVNNSMLPVLAKVFDLDYKKL